MVETKIGTITKVSRDEMFDEYESLDNDTKLKLKPFLLDIRNLKEQYANADDDQVKQELRAKQYQNLVDIQDIIVANQTTLTKAGNIMEEASTGANKGLTEILGFPVDISNIALFKGEEFVRGVLKDAGFNVKTENYTPYFSSANPIGGSESIQGLLNHVGIRTDIDQSRASTAIAGRIGQEVGMTIPFFGFAAKTAAPGKTMLGEFTLAGTAGTAGAIAQQMEASPLNEAYATALGYLTPLSLYKIVPKQSIVDAFNVTFRPATTAKNSATVVLANALLKDGKITQKQFDTLVNELASGNTDVLGTTLNTTAFPRLLSEISDTPGLAGLQNVLVQGPDGGRFISELDSIKKQQNAVLEVVFLQRLDEIVKASKGDKDVVAGLLNKYPALDDYYNVRLAIAEENTAGIINKLGDNVNPQIASEIYQKELQDALDDALRMEKTLYSKLGNLPTSALDEIKVGFQSIINNNLKTDAATGSIPSIIEEVAGKSTVTKTTTDARGAIGGPPGDETEVTSIVSLLDNIDTNKATSEVLNLRSHLFDLKAKEIRKGANANVEKIKNIEDAIGVIDVSLQNGFSKFDQSFFDATNALDHSANIRSKFYDNSDIGGLLGYNNSTGQIGVLNNDKLQSLINKGNIDNFVDALEVTSEGLKQNVLQNFANQFPDGQVTQKLLTKFIEKNQNTINEYPELAEAFLDLDSAQKVVTQIKEKSGNFGLTFNQLKKDRAVLLLDSTVDQSQLTLNGLLDQAFKQSNIDKKSATLNKYLENVADDTIGLAGLQEGVTNYMFNTLKTKAIQPKTKGEAVQYVFDVKGTQKFIKDNEDFLLQLYGEEGFQVIKQMESELSLINKAITNPGQFADTLGEIGKNNLFVSSIGRIGGSHIASLTGGPALVFASIGGRLANNLIGQKSLQETLVILNEAFTNPKFAAELLEPLNKEMIKEKERIINGVLSKNSELLTAPAPARTIETLSDEERKIDLPGDALDITVPLPFDSSRLNAPIDASVLASANVVNPNVTRNTAQAGQQVFGVDDPVFSGIVNTNVGRQVVA